MTASERLPVWVPGNRWSDLAPPEIGTWEPELPLSVVVPYYQRSQELILTLAGLDQQTYPAHLFEVIVVDDGSPTDPPRLPPDLTFSLTVLRQEDMGYGLARARNYGAREAQGDLLVFLDCDMIPERQHLEAHARWHHLAKGLVTLGFRRHTDFAGVTRDQVASAVAYGTMDELVSGRRVSWPEWIEEYLIMTDDLLGPFDHLYAVMSGGNLGIDRTLYLEAGGTDESFTRWGGEDNEFAYRALQLGAVVVPERAALAWHQGGGDEPTEDDRHALRLQRPRLQNLIPPPWTRVLTPGRIYERPYLTVFIPARGLPAEVIGVAIDSLLAGDFTDLVVGAGHLSNSDERDSLTDTYRADPRVLIGVDETEMAGRFPFSPIRMTLPGGFAAGVDTVRLIADQMGAAGVGLLRFTLSKQSPVSTHGRVTLTRAENRARRIGGPRDELIGDLFGEKWVSGSSVGVWAVEELDEARARVRARVNSSRDQTRDLEEARATIDELSNRRALIFADSVGSLLRARSAGELRGALASITRVISRGSARQRQMPRGGR
jgi:glycosyltransferase involved in cell wall biosynthesis